MGHMRCELSKFVFFILHFSFCIALFSACTRTKPTLEYMPDMADGASVKAYESDPAFANGRSAQPPVKGTIPRGFEPYHYTDDPSDAGTNLRNPLPRSAEILAKGQKTFETYCLVCHGSRGLGDGPIVPKFPKPASLVSQKVVDWQDGRIFHVITRGQNLMPGYASQMSPAERWTVVHYVRVLQKAAHPTEEDIKAATK